mgnify:CR=1 FL=1
MWNRRDSGGGYSILRSASTAPISGAVPGQPERFVFASEAAYKAEPLGVTRIAKLRPLQFESEMDFVQARYNMVESQVRPADVTDGRIADAMLKLPRELFVPKNQMPLAYMDECVALSTGRQLMEPRCFAKMLQAVQVRSSDVVLDVGCGTGYSTAVLASLASVVVGLESDEILARLAQDLLSQLGIVTATIATGPLVEGAADQGPFSVIFINGAIGVQPTSLLEQLSDGGRLVAVFRSRERSQARVITKTVKAGIASFSSRTAFDASIRPLPEFEAKEEFAF